MSMGFTQYVCNEGQISYEDVICLTFKGKFLDLSISKDDVQSKSESSFFACD